MEPVGYDDAGGNIMGPERQHYGFRHNMELSPDFRFERAGANLLILSGAFIHAGPDARSQVRRIYTQWVKSKTSRFAMFQRVSESGFPRVAGDFRRGFDSGPKVGRATGVWRIDPAA